MGWKGSGAAEEEEEEEKEAAHLEASSLENQLICLTSVSPDSLRVATSCAVCHHFLSAESSRS